MRTFEQSHPWISFSFSLKDARPQLWLLLGEAASKCEHLAGVPLQPNIASELHRLYLAKGALASTAIEGNTLSEAQALEQVDGKLSLPPSQEYLGQEIKNIIDACRLIAGNANTETDVLDADLIKNFHRMVLNDLPGATENQPGEFRIKSVVVGNVYRGAPAADCSYLVDRLCQWLNGKDFEAQPGHETVYALIKAVIAHLYLAWIHPFNDGNGRTSRLIEFYILIHARMPFPAAHLLSNHYNKTRSEYYRQLQVASASGGDILPFIEYAIRGFVDGLKEQLQYIQFQHFDMTWRNFVHEQFRDKAAKTEKRRRDLLLELPINETPINELFDRSPRLARLYSGKSIRTLTRDITELKRLGLIEQKGKSVRACKDIMFAFLPARKSRQKFD